jgi:hypothetical protein
MDFQQKPEDTRGPETKRQYHRPKLEVYGDLGSMTASVGMNGKSDGAPGKGSNKTLP